jgi:hypothetical protein
MLRAWRKLSPEKRWALVGGPVAVGLLTGVLTTQANIGIDALTGDDPAAEIAAREAIVLNPSGRAIDRSLGPWPDPTDPEFAGFMRRRRERLAPRVEIVVYNAGDRTAILNRMRFTLRERLYLPTCYLQGDLSVAKGYDVTLPRGMRPGELAHSQPLRRQLAPDEPERLEFRFRLPPADHPLDDQDDNYFYRLDVALLHDDEEGPVDVGTIVVSLPSGPTEDQIWTRADERVLRLPGVSVPSGVVACMKANSERLRGFLAGAGTRSAQLRSLGRRLAKNAQ